MGCCMSHIEPPIDEPRMNHIVESHTISSKSADPKQFRHIQEPQICYNSTTEDENCTDNKPHDIDIDIITRKKSDASSVDDEVLPSTEMEEKQKSDFQIKIEERKSELLQEKQKLKELQQDAFEQQVEAQQSQNGYKRLYDVWKEFATNDNLTKMDINGLTKALAVFGMVINTNRDFQKHIFKKFDIDNEKEIGYDDFSATIASFVGSNTDDDSLQTLFEIFDIDQDGYLEIDDMARILLAQNQITMVVTGQQKEESTITYTKKQCLKQAKKMIQKYDSDKFNDNKISFNEFKQMMNSRTESDMIINRMQTPSISQKDNVSSSKR